MAVVSDGAFGYSLPMFPPSPIEEAWRRVQHQATQSIATAVTSWAEQVNMSVDEWLDVYEPHAEIVPHEAESNLVTLRVTARMRSTKEMVLPA